MEINSIDKYHNDVLTYEVTDNEGELVSIFMPISFQDMEKEVELG